MEIIIGFSRSKHWYKVGSKLIRLAEKTNFSHVYLRIQDSLTDEPMVYQASLGSVNTQHFDVFKENNIVVEEVKLYVTVEQFHTILKFLQQNMGKKYSKLQIAILTVMKLLGRKTPIFTYDNDEFICSELGYNVLQLLGLYPKENVDYKTPSDVRRELQKLGR